MLVVEFVETFHLVESISTIFCENSKMSQNVKIRIKIIYVYVPCHRKED
jgi:hypothetical protein